MHIKLETNEPLSCKVRVSNAKPSRRVLDSVSSEDQIRQEIAFVRDRGKGRKRRGDGRNGERSIQIRYKLHLSWNSIPQRPDERQRDREEKDRCSKNVCRLWSFRTSTQDQAMSALAHSFIPLASGENANIEGTRNEPELTVSIYNSILYSALARGVGRDEVRFRRDMRMESKIIRVCNACECHQRSRGLYEYIYIRTDWMDSPFCIRS